MQKNIVYQSWPNLEEETKAKLFSISKPQEMNPRLLSSNIIGRVLILETPNSASKTVRIRKPKKRKWRLKTKVKSVLVCIIQRQILPKMPDTVLWSSVPHISISMNFFSKKQCSFIQPTKKKIYKILRKTTSTPTTSTQSTTSLSTESGFDFFLPNYQFPWEDHKYQRPKRPVKNARYGRFDSYHSEPFYENYLEIMPLSVYRDYLQPAQNHHNLLHPTVPFLTILFLTLG